MKLVKSPGLWDNMAHSSIKTRRPEVVDFCLSNMEHARAAQAARWASAGFDVDPAHLLIVYAKKKLAWSSLRYWTSDCPKQSTPGQHRQPGGDLLLWQIISSLKDN